jgi:hypothetical protein
MAEMSGVFELFVDGVPTSYVTEVEEEVMSEDKPVKTLRLGLAGYSNGAESVRVTFKNAIPQAGREIDFRQYVRTHRTVKVAVRGGSSTLTGEGRIMTVRGRSSTDNPNEMDVTFEGRLLSNG